MSDELSQVCRALCFAKADAFQAPEGGFVAMAWLDVRTFNPHQRSSLESYLTGHIDSNAQRFMSPVVDSQEVPIVFDSEQSAQAEARQRASNLQREYLYGAYADLGIVLEMNSGQTLHFQPRKKLN